MKILLTGANGYVGMRLLPVLIEEGHEVICLVRDKNRFFPPGIEKRKLTIIEWDLLKDEGLEEMFSSWKADVAYYFVHSLTGNPDTLKQMEISCACCFIQISQIMEVKQVVYLGGIANGKKLSKHLHTRKIVEKLFINSGLNYTIFEAGIIVGSGSASFEIIRDIVEKLPVIVGPTWLNSLCQPIAIRNVIGYLNGCKLIPETFAKVFEIGGPEILTYKKMLHEYAIFRGYRRLVIVTPFISIGVSSYWLNFISSVNYNIARQLVESLRNNVTCKESSIQEIIPQKLFTYKESLQLAFKNIEDNMVISSWKDAASSSLKRLNISKIIKVPEFGCFKNRQTRQIGCEEVDKVLNKIFSIGGKKGYYFATNLWKIRGFIDTLSGGVGLKRGRRSGMELRPGDALDFWRVLLADKTERRLLLYAEMKVPGDAWLEFSIDLKPEYANVTQTATFRPKGIAGRLYWIVLLPVHIVIFKNMINNILK